MSNPNNCDTCGHKKKQDVIEKAVPQDVKLHCYMFRDVPTDVCMQHTGRQLNSPIQGSIVDMVNALRASGAVIEEY